MSGFVTANELDIIKLTVHSVGRGHHSIHISQEMGVQQQTDSRSVIWRVQAIWNSLTQPNASIQGDDARDRVRILSSFLLILIPLVLIDIWSNVRAGRLATPSEIIVVGFGVAYLLSRTRYYSIGSTLMVVMLSSIPFVTILLGAETDPDHLTITFIWMVVALLACLNLFSLRAAMTLIALDVIEIAILALYMQPTVIAPLLEPFDLVAIMAGLLVNAGLARQRDLRRIDRQFATLSQAEANAREQLNLSEALRDNAAALGSLLDVGEILDQILTNISHVFPNDFANISLIEQGMVQVVRFRGYSEDSPEAQVLNSPYPVSWFHNVRYMLDTGQPIAIPNTYEDPEWVKVSKAPQIRSYLAAPIRLDREIIGFINLSSSTPGTYSYAQAMRLQAFADQAAIAIRNARLFAAQLEQRQLAEALRDSIAALTSTLKLEEVLDRILSYISQVVRHDAMDIMLIEAGVCRVVRFRGYTERGLEEDIANVRLRLSEVANFRWMTEHGLPLVIPDVQLYPDWLHRPMSEWIRSYVGAPIVLDGETVGFVNLNSSKPGNFNASHAESLRIFADQVAVALRNARLYDQIRRYAGTLEKEVSLRTAELELERSRLQVILDATGEGIFYTEGLTIQYANPALERLTGYEQTELRGKASTLFRGSDNPKTDTRSFTSITQAAAHGGVWRDEVKMRRKDNSEFDAGLTVSLLGDSEGSSRRTVTVVRDISAEKALQEEKSRFVAYASHELRTPITNLMTRLHLARRQPERVADHLDVAEEVARRMRNLVEDLLDLSRFERGVLPLNPHNVVLQTLVAGIVEVQQPEAERKSISLVQELEEEPVHAEVDVDRFNQVVTNLVTNAINYTANNGEVMVKVWRDGQKEQAIVEVKDNGRGISANDLQYIFQPFYRGDESVKGTGLGLSIAQEIIKMHHGEIYVQSEVGHGSTFSVRLPLTSGTTDVPSSAG